MLFLSDILLKNMSKVTQYEYEERAFLTEDQFLFVKTKADSLG